MHMRRLLGDQSTKQYILSDQMSHLANDDNESQATLNQIVSHKLHRLTMITPQGNILREDRLVSRTVKDHFLNLLLMLRRPYPKIIESAGCITVN
jgi:hypothetical protein